MERYNIAIRPRTLHFKRPAKTSRGAYTTRQIWLLELTSPDVPGAKGIGECAPLPDLSCDASPDYEQTLRSLCDRFVHQGSIDYDMMRPYPSMLFGLETALLHFRSEKKRVMQPSGAAAPAVPLIFDTPFSRGEEGIPTNGLVWMGTLSEMKSRIEEKLMQGFRCIKLKIGSLNLAGDIAMVKSVRSYFSSKTVELRVDANGAFLCGEALNRLELLALFDIHSIEQPIKQGQWSEMARLCRDTPLPIALDEELIGVNKTNEKRLLLDTIKPSFLVLKPSLHGGVGGVAEWVELARRRGIGTWITSALESNVGLNAIAQLAARLYGPGVKMPQGLGTGQLFTDNIDLPLEIRNAQLWAGKANGKEGTSAQSAQ